MHTVSNVPLTCKCGSLYWATSNIQGGGNHFDLLPMSLMTCISCGFRVVHRSEGGCVDIQPAEYFNTKQKYGCI